MPIPLSNYLPRFPGIEEFQMYRATYRDAQGRELAGEIAARSQEEAEASAKTTAAWYSMTVVGVA